MAKQKTAKRLERLVHCGLCKGEDSTQYAAELKQLAHNVADAKSALRESKYFKALADQTRLRILGLLEIREMCVCELMTALSLTQPTTSHHLQILENAGIVKNRKAGKWVFYSVAQPRLLAEAHKLKLA